MVTYRAGNTIAGTASQRGSLTTTNLEAGTRFFEEDTDDFYQWDGDSWNIIAGNTVAQTLVNKTLTSPVINTPTIGTSLSLLQNATIIFEGSTDDGNETTLTVADPTGDRVISLPDATDTLVGKATTDTLTNKTLTSPAITAPAITGGTAIELTNLSIRDESVAYDLIIQSNDAQMAADRSLIFDVNNANRTITFGGDVTLANSLTTSGNYTLTLTQTGNTGVTLPTTGTLSTLAGAETLTNKTLTSPVINTSTIGTTLSLLEDATIVFEGATNNSNETTLTVVDPTGDRTISLPDATDTLVGKATTDVLTNKTLTSPQINDTSSNHQYIFAVSELAADRTVTLPLLTGNDTFTFNGFAATLTNKTIDSDNNTITNIVNADVKASAAIVDTKLATITTGNKVSGSAVQLAGTSAIENSTGLQLKAALAGDGLALSSQVLAVNVDDSSIETNSDALRVKAAGITNAMLAGSIANGKLSGPSIAVTDGSTASNIAPGGTLTFAATANETTVAQSGGTVTIGMPNNVTIGGILTVTGNLVVNGTTTTVNSTVTTVDDPVFTIGGDTAPGSDDNKDRGIEFRYHTGSAAAIGFFGYDDSAGVFTGFTGATNSSEVFSGTVINATFGNIAGTLTTAAQGNITSLGTLSAVTVSGATTLNGDVDLGNATSDTITATGRFDSDLVPSSDDARDLGTADLEWQDLFLDGTANIDILTADAGTVGGSDIVTLAATQTLAAKTLTAPKFADGGFIADAAGLELVILDSVSSAVNEITIANAASGASASITASGETDTGIILRGKGTSGITITNVTANGAFLELDTKAAPADPATEAARIYLKQVDANNNAIAVKIQKGGAIQEVEITSPRAVCAECGRKDGAKDPLYDFERGVMVLDLWCGHSFEVPMQWSQINGS